MIRMMDPIISLTQSIFSNKGVYALLIGSGLSRSAEIPTGWDITLDLIKRIARLEGAKNIKNYEKWYFDTKGNQPNYSELLHELAKTPEERRAILHSYIDPSPEDIEEGRKVPTKAHKSIAWLVFQGYIKVIVTTNFDRLLENALREVGVEPTIISSVDHIKGAPPIAHCKCVIVKVHGDYLDTRIRNTAKELEDYDPEMSAYLDRIFDEFGLIVCGWSGSWDTALRDTIIRCPNRRFSTFWTSMSDPNSQAEDLINIRQAQKIKINNADDFFEKLIELLGALNDIGQSSPLTAKAAQALVKKYLSEPKYKIKLHDLVIDETKSSASAYMSKYTMEGTFSNEEFHERVKSYEASTEILCKLIMVGCYWSQDNHHNLWLETIKRIALSKHNVGGLTVWLELQNYPAVLVLFSGLLGALAAQNYALFNSLASAKIGSGRDKDAYVQRFLPVNMGVDRDVWQRLPGHDRRHSPLSDHILDVLSSNLMDFVVNQNECDDLFDRCEVLAAFVLADIGNTELDPEKVCFPPGRYAWRMRSYGSSSIRDWFEEAKTQKEGWGPLQQGMFGGSYQRFSKLLECFDNFIRRIAQYYY